MKVTSPTTLAEVTEVVAVTLGVTDRAGTFTADTTLLGSMPELDSMAVVELIAALERRFGFTVADDEVTGEIFETLGGLAAFVEERRGC